MLQMWKVWHSFRSNTMYKHVVLALHLDNLLYWFLLLVDYKNHLFDCKPVLVLESLIYTLVVSFWWKEKRKSHVSVKKFEWVIGLVNLERLETAFMVTYVVIAQNNVRYVSRCVVFVAWWLLGLVNYKKYFSNNKNNNFTTMSVKGIIL